MTAPSLLEIDMVSKHYDTKVALDQVSLSARQGRILGLLGPNGAGKSSLIRIINRITAPDRGSRTSAVSATSPRNAGSTPR